MSANSCANNALAGIQLCAGDVDSRQVTDRAMVTSRDQVENSLRAEEFVLGHRSKSNADNQMQRCDLKLAARFPRNALRENELAVVGDAEDGGNSDTECKKSIRTATLARWLKFNFVGGIGIVVQFVVLYFLKTVLHFDYLFATAVAVEAAVVHNFAWHEQFTWSDRVQPSWRESLPRLLRFNLANGGVSIIGNLVLMKVMVGMGRMNYLAANVVAIALCSVANFLVSEEWVFGEKGSSSRCTANAAVRTEVKLFLQRQRQAGRSARSTWVR
jgi:putative flippase GtrA